MTEKRWRLATLTAEDGHMVMGFLPAGVASEVGDRVRISGISYTVVEPLRPSVTAIPPGHGYALFKNAEAIPREKDTDDGEDTDV